MKTHRKKHDIQKQQELLDGLDIDIEDDVEVCPECGTRTIVLDMDKCEEYCTQCGYITRAASCYVGGRKIILPYGLIII